MHSHLIWAQDLNGGIGIDNKLPWHVSEDLKNFKYLTKNSAIVMGRKTWDSIPKKPLPKRFHIILTKTPESVDISDKKYENCIALSSINEIEQFCLERNFANSWIIGGQSIYETYLNQKYISDIHITKVNKDFDCDVFFPEIPSDFSIVDKEETLENNVKLDFIHYSKS